MYQLPGHFTLFSGFLEAFSIPFTHSLTPKYFFLLWHLQPKQTQTQLSRDVIFLSQKSRKNSVFMDRCLEYYVALQR